VFDAWLDPDTARKFLFTAPGGVIVRIEIEPRVGGRFLIVDRRADQDIEHVGAYLDIDRPQRLMFSFAVPAFSEQSTNVTVDIAQDEAGSALTLTHEGVLPEWVEQTRAGWTMILEGLAKALQA